MGQEPGCLIHLQLPVQPPAVDVITQLKHSCYFSAMKFYIAVGQTSGQQNGVIRHFGMNMHYFEYKHKTYRKGEAHHR